jgi:hypothetical protein
MRRQDLRDLRRRLTKFLNSACACGRGARAGLALFERRRASGEQGRRPSSYIVATTPILECCAGRFVALRSADTIGCPLGSESFLDEIAALTGRDARPAK